MCEYTNIDKENKGQLLSFIQFKQGGKPALGFHGNDRFRYRIVTVVLK